METQTFFVIAAFVLAYGVVSRRIESTIFTAPMIFAVFGMIACPDALGLFDLSLDDRIVYLIAELTLALVLFTDASRIDLHILREEAGIPLRMLAIGLPLTIALGGLIAMVLFEAFSAWEAFLLAAILAPTDAALGQTVVTDERVPVSIRQAVNVESGLNDGMALPAVLLFATFAAGAADMAHTATMESRHGYHAPDNWGVYIAQQLTLGPIAGLAVGLAGGWLVNTGIRAGWVSRAYQGLAGPALALLAFAFSNLIGGNGFIAAFVAGMAAGGAFKSVVDRFQDFSEAEGDLLVLISFMLYGALMVWPAFRALTWQTALYVGLSLTAIRMAPAALSLSGLGLRLPTLLFLGWFGPRGLASIIFGLLVIGQAQTPHSEQIFHIVSLTVLVSIFAHGFSARPLSAWYGRFATRHCSAADAGEQRKTSEHRLRVRGS